MIRRATFLVAIVAAPAAFATGLWHGQHPAAAPAVAGVRINAPLLVQPGAGVDEAGRYFAALNAPPPPPPPPASMRPPPPPPPPDVAELFRRDLSAVLAGPGAEPRVVLTGSRSLKPGDVYRDGWTLSSLSNTTAVLEKGKDHRNIGLFSPPPASMTQVATAAPSITLGTQFSMTNGVRAGRPGPGQIAAVVGAFGGTGMNQQQLERISTMLSNGQFDYNAAMQILSQSMRNGQMTTAQMNTVVQALQRAGVVDQRQAQQMAQLLPQMQSQQAAQQVLNLSGPPRNQNGPGGGGGGGGGNRGGGGRGPNQGFGGPGGQQGPNRPQNLGGGNVVPLPAGAPAGANTFFTAPPPPPPVIR